MHRLFLLAITLLSVGPPLHADNLLQNSDFSSAGAHWQGDGSSFAANKLPTGTFGATGLVVILNPQAWTKIYQAFTGDKGTLYSIDVTYRVSQDLTLSQRASDYAAVNKHIGLAGYENFGEFNLPVGQFLGTIGDSNSTKVAYEVYVPQFKSTDVQTYHHTYPAIAANGNNIAALGFPPGKGSVNILSVSVTSQ